MLQSLHYRGKSRLLNQLGQKRHQLHLCAFHTLQTLM
uniref:Uncharacterized protein n=1 Tax=Rhizophora mucronata TaxID=61149 RepID=A0A2P2JFN0_RHIMU